MIEKLKQSWPARLAGQFKGWVQDFLTPALLRRRTFGAAFLASLVAVVYWGVFASNRYVSEAHIVVQSTDSSVATGQDVLSLLMSSSSSSHADQMMLRDYLLSVDMLKKLDAKLKLRQHFSNWRKDPLSRMWLENAPIEWFHRYYLSRVTVEMDEYSGVLVIQAQAYDPQTAHAITSVLVEEGERYMNELAHRLARDQVQFLEKQVSDLSDRALKARDSVVDFQNAHGLASPTATADAITTITNRLESQVAELKAKRGGLLTYLSSDAPDIVQLNSQIAALETQISIEQGRVASPKGKALNRVVEQYQRLQMSAQFAQDMYQTALAALEKGRIEATRNLKKVSVLQSPTMPEYPLEPRRIYNIIVFILSVMILAGIIHLVAAIIRDHKD